MFCKIFNRESQKKKMSINSGLAGSFVSCHPQNLTFLQPTRITARHQVIPDTLGSFLHSDPLTTATGILSLAGHPHLSSAPASHHENGKGEGLKAGWPEQAVLWGYWGETLGSYNSSSLFQSHPKEMCILRKNSSFCKCSFQFLPLLWAPRVPPSKSLPIEILNPILARVAVSTLPLVHAVALAVKRQAGCFRAPGLGRGIGEWQALPCPPPPAQPAVGRSAVSQATEREALFN